MENWFSTIQTKPIFNRESLNLSKFNYRPFVVWFFGTLYFVALISLVAYSIYQLPAPLGAEIEASRFSEARARVHLDYIVNRIGPHPIGTEANRNATKNYILGQLQVIANQAAGGPVRVEISVPNEPHCKVAVGAQRTVCWNALDNIVARLVPKRAGTWNHSANTILLSSHYDTVTMSPGAYDDSTGVAAMLELVSALTWQAWPGDADIIALWNNGQEMNSLGATAFQSSVNGSSVQGFVNFAGIPGRKSLLFQTTGGYLDKHMHAVPRPFTTVVAEDFFRNSAIRLFDSQDSDFAVLSQTANGVDFTFFEYRQRFHTMKDAAVEQGSLQFLGDNVLALIQSVLQSDDLNESHPNAGLSSTLVFFDVFGLFYVSFSRNLSFALHCVVTASLVIALIIVIFLTTEHWHSLHVQDKIMIRHPGWQIITLALQLLFSLGVCMGFSALVGLCLDRINPKCFYDSVMFAVTLFTFSTLFAYSLVHYIMGKLPRGRCGIPRSLFLEYDETRLPPIPALYLFHHAFVAVTALWTTVMVVMLPFSYFYGSTYLALFPGIFYLGLLIAQQGFMYYKTRNHDVSGATHTVTLLEESVREPDTLDRYSSTDFSRCERRWLGHTSVGTCVWFIVVFMMSTLPLVLLLQVTHIVLQFISSQIPTYMIGVTLAVVVFFVFCNFYPITSISDVYGTMTVVFGLSLLIMFVISATTFPFSLARPWTAQVTQSIDVNANSSLITVTAAWVDGQHFPTVQSILKTFNVTKSTINCIVANGVETCNYAVPFPNITLPKIDWAMEPVANTTTFEFICNVTSPHAFVHTIHLTLPGGTIPDMSMNGQPIKQNKPAFTFVFRTDEPWQYQAHLSPMIGPPASNLTMRLESSIDAMEYSAEIKSLVDKLPEWIAVQGTGSGLINIFKTLVMKVQ